MQDIINKFCPGNFAPFSELHADEWALSWEKVASYVPWVSSVCSLSLQWVVCVARKPLRLMVALSRLLIVWVRGEFSFFICMFSSTLRSQLSISMFNLLYFSRGFSCVDLVEERGTRKSFAAKRIICHSSHDEQVARKEIEYMRKFNHKNLVPCEGHVIYPAKNHATAISEIIIIMPCYQVWCMLIVTFMSVTHCFVYLILGLSAVKCPCYCFRKGQCRMNLKSWRGHQVICLRLAYFHYCLVWVRDSELCIQLHRMQLLIGRWYTNLLNAKYSCFAFNLCN